MTNQHCSKCQLVFNENSQLISFSCSHKVCAFCYLQNLFRADFSFLSFPSLNETTLSCPICFKSTLIMTIREFFSLLTSSQKSKKCAKHNKDVSQYCVSCKLCLCEDCVKDFHSFYFPTHKLEPYEQFMQLQRRKMCSLHKNKPIKYKCLECKEYMCSICADRKHSKHDKVRLSDIIKKAIGKIKFKNYDSFALYLNNKETDIKDQIYIEQNKNIMKIDFLIKQLQNIRVSYMKKIEHSFSELNNFFDFNRHIYYYYYLMLQSNDVNINPILSYEQTNSQIDPELTNKKIFNFLDVYIRPENTLDILELIESQLNTFEILQPFDVHYSHLLLTGKKLFNTNIKPTEHWSSVTSITNFNNKTFAVATDQGYIYLHKSSSLQFFKAHDSAISSLISFPCDNEENTFYLISGSIDKSINVFKISKDNQITMVNSLKGHENEIRCLLYLNTSSEQTLFASGSLDTNIKIWSISSMESKQTLTGHKGGVISLCLLNHTNKLLSSGEDFCIFVWDILSWDIPSFELDKVLEMKDEPVITCMNSLEGDLMLINGKNGTFRLFDVEECRILETFNKHTKDITGFIQLENKSIVCFGKDKRLSLWNVTENICYTIATCHLGEILVGCLYLADNSLFITGGSDGEVIQWENAY